MRERIILRHLPERISTTVADPQAPPIPYPIPYYIINWAATELMYLLTTVVDIHWHVNFP